MRINRFQYISQEINGKTHEELIREACIAGVKWVQLRVKDKSYEDTLRIAKVSQEICREYRATLIINDHVAIAKEIQADGVHLGRTDMDPSKAREIVGREFIIGGTANTIEDILLLAKSKVDYIGLGPYRHTTTKENLSPILGVEGYSKLMDECDKEGVIIPVIAIGGILPADVQTILKQGVYGVAVSSVINIASDKKEVIDQINRSIEEYRLMYKR